MLKRCSKCKLELDTNNFCKDNSKSDGLFIWCNKCRKEYRDSTKERRSEYWNKNKQKFLKQNKEYCLKNRDLLRVKARDRYLSHKDKSREVAKECRAKHKEEISLKKKAWRETPEGKECYHKARQKYVEANSDKIKESRKKYKANKLATDPIFKFKEYFGNIFRYSLKKNKISKHNKPTFSMLGYSLDELKFHIESQFEPWMNWNNQGSYNKHTWDDNDQFTWTWQIDHIIPNSTFIYNSIDDDSFKQCWALSNLRPLSAKQNWLDGIYRNRHKTKILKYTIDNIWKYESGNYWVKGMSNEQDDLFQYERWSKRITYKEVGASSNEKISIYRTTLLDVNYPNWTNRTTLLDGNYPNWTINFPMFCDLNALYNSIYKDGYRVFLHAEDAMRHIDNFLLKIEKLKTFI